MNNPPDNTGKKQVCGTKGRFTPGTSGNKFGRPKGSRNQASLLAEMLLDEEVTTLTKKVIALAKSGDSTTLRIVFERLLPPRKDRYVSFDLPKLNKNSNLVKLMRNRFPVVTVCCALILITANNKLIIITTRFIMFPFIKFYFNKSIFFV